MERKKQQLAIYGIVFSTISICLYSILIGLKDAEPNEYLWKFWSTAVALLVAYWVIQDARLRSIGSPYTNGFLLVFLWPILIPIYAFKSRGVRGTWFIFGLAVVFMAPSISYVLGYWLS
jgi:hypothetical protein